jgi:hypothetical protein
MRFPPEASLTMWTAAPHPLEPFMTRPQRRRRRLPWLAGGAIVLSLAVILGTALYLVRADERTDREAAEEQAEAAPAEVTTDLCGAFDANGIGDIVPETDTGRTDADIGPDPDNAEIETTLTCWWGDQEQWTGWVLARFWPTEAAAAEAVDDDRAGTDLAGYETGDYTGGFSAVIPEEDGRELLGLITANGRVEAHVYAFLDPAVHDEDALWTALDDLQGQCKDVFAPFVY